MEIRNRYNYQELSRVKHPNGRYYDVGEKRPLPSVTTVLSKTQDKTAIKEWKQRVGDAEATRVVSEATLIGDNLHKNLERYILGDPLRTGPLMAKIQTDLIIKRGFVKVDEVWGTEVPLYYPELYAGTTDLVGVFDGSPAIMDFKNARRMRKPEWITDYFLQLTAYAEAHNKLYGTDIRKGVIMMVDRDGNYKEFVIEDDEFDVYKGKWFDALHSYYETFGFA